MQYPPSTIVICQGPDIRPGVKNKEAKTGLGHGPSTSGESTSLKIDFDCICTPSKRVGRRYTYTIVMDVAVRDLGAITALVGDNEKWNERHSKLGPRDMLSSLETTKKRGRGTVLNSARCRGMAMWSQCIAIGWPVQGVKT